MTVVDGPWKDNNRIPSGGGPPYDGDMEERVRELQRATAGIRDALARIEAKLDGVEKETNTVRSDLSYLKGKLEGIPSSWQMIATVIGGNIALAGMFYGVLRLYIR